MRKDIQDSAFLAHNKSSWDRQAKTQSPWSLPVSSELIQDAKNGQWEIYLTPSPLPKGWLGEVKGKKILCLASAGGQQAPLLAALGAEVIVLDLSKEQLFHDRMVAERDQLELITIEGDMRDLSEFEDNSFDLIFHPISNHYVPDVRPVWKECYRVLKSGGALLSSFFNPAIFIGDRDPAYMDKGIIYPRYKIPYSDLIDLEETLLEKKRENNEAFVFGHSLKDLIGGQLAAGFVISDFLEDNQPNPRFLIDKYMPTFLATKAIKQ
ncbi:SAM-dependent methyltransferase [Pedobacter sp. KBW06]|uniref:class I SAM-dependent methyltransferase n=1 Tax=Pedobacter sp. KBW06 TaxID=2153359 RepID=UPI000F5A0895|nr:class I SAM-dependent methyltransferase [Pedobacter sp. KBW06]RQO75255.1 SAM-dependent methyltransferase [Pedobacter sp. KBW06]